MENKDNLYRNLVILLKIFKNRPNHLAKYLIDNGAFSEDFIVNLLSSEKLNDINPDEVSNYFSDPIDVDAPYFSDYEQMNEYYNKMMMQDVKQLQDPEEVVNRLNSKLQDLISEEKYEEAANLRDYMIRNKIKII